MSFPYTVLANHQPAFIQREIIQTTRPREEQKAEAAAAAGASSGLAEQTLVPQEVKQTHEQQLERTEHQQIGPDSLRSFSALWNSRVVLWPSAGAPAALSQVCKQRSTCRYWPRRLPSPAQYLWPRQVRRC